MGDALGQSSSSSSSSSRTARAAAHRAPTTRARGLSASPTTTRRADRTARRRVRGRIADHVAGRCGDASRRRKGAVAAPAVGATSTPAPSARPSAPPTPAPSARATRHPVPRPTLPPSSAPTCRAVNGRADGPPTAAPSRPRRPPHGDDVRCRPSSGALYVGTADYGACARSTLSLSQLLVEQPRRRLRRAGGRSYDKMTGQLFFGRFAAAPSARSRPTWSTACRAALAQPALVDAQRGDLCRRGEPPRLLRLARRGAGRSTATTSRGRARRVARVGHRFSRAARSEIGGPRLLSTYSDGEVYQGGGSRRPRRTSRASRRSTATRAARARPRARCL